MLQQYFGCGTIRPDRSDKTLKFEIRSLDELIEKVIPHFEEFPLISSKQRDFEFFAEICRMMCQGEHHEVDGFNQIIELVFKMNSSGIRKYTKEEIKL